MMRSLTYWMFAFVVFAVSASVDGETTFDAAARAKAIGPFVEEETAVVVYVDISRVAVESLCDIVGRIVPMSVDELGRARREMAKQQGAWLSAGVKEFYGVVTLKGEGRMPQVHFIAPLPPGMDEEMLRSTLQISGDTGQMVEGAFVFSTMGLPLGRQMEKSWKLQAVERPELVAAFEAAGDTAAQVILIPPAQTRRVVEELLPEFPKVVGGGPISILTRGISWAAAGIDLLPHISVRLVVKSEDAQAAEALRTKLAELVRLAGEQKEVREKVPEFEAVAALLTPRVEGDRLIILVDEKTETFEKALIGLTRPILEAKARSVSQNNLKHIGLAMHNYYDANKHFPLPASRGPDGKPLLSWRVHILPYIEQDALFKQFHLDEPWDSPHNRMLIDQMPAVYRLPISKSEKGRTNYLLPVGNGAAFSDDKPTELKDITDGTSNTIMVVEVDDEHAAIWTKPDDWAFDPNDPTKGLGRFFGGSFNATICDGSVLSRAWLQEPKDVETLRAAFTRAGGEVVEW